MFCATCGRMSISRIVFTKARVSYALSAPTLPALPPIAPFVIQHHQRCLAFGCSVGLRQHGVHDQTVAILHQHVAQIAEFGFLAISLAVQSRFGIGLVTSVIGMRRAARPGWRWCQ